MMIKRCINVGYINTVKYIYKLYHIPLWKEYFFINMLFVFVSSVVLFETVLSVSI